jgi:hypothetical protein
MKNYSILLVFTAFLFSVSCNDNQQGNTGNEYNINNPESASGNSSNGLPEISFEELEYNFGTLIQGEKVSHNFKFTNTGEGNLVISNVGASCGCTAPKWSKEPIKPGDSGHIEVVFDSKGREGKQTKSVKVFANTQPNSTDLVIRCDIVN